MAVEYSQGYRSINRLQSTVDFPHGNSFFRIGIFNVDVITVIGYAIQDGFSLCVLSAERMKPTLFENL